MILDSVQRGAQLLESLADELDVSPSKYQDAKDRYDAVGNWIGDGDKLKPRSPRIYPQGSFALGTAIRPLGDDEYDVDAVCQIAGMPAITQQDLKGLVGDRLKEHGTYRRMLDPEDGGRRCWTLQYADGSKFHLDVLPAILDPDYWQLIALGVPEPLARTALLITDKTKWHNPKDWCRTNPLGYAAWFTHRMQVRLDEEKRRLAASRRASVQNIQDFEVRTPLQRLVQLLKRHRDVYFTGNPNRPISVIITTLAARAYNNEADLAEAILNVVPAMRGLVEKVNGIYVIKNPVNPAENFADRWQDEPERAAAFLEWIDAVERDHRLLLSDQGMREADTRLAESYGDRDAAAALKRAGFTSAPVVRRAPAPLARFNVSHRQQVMWPAVAAARVPIRATWKKYGVTHKLTSDSAPIPKGADLMFYADGTVVDGPVEVYWQVVNTGAEAAAEPGGLRGQIRPAGSAGRGGLTQKESTKYRGSHTIECFVVQNGRCVGRSGEFIVNIQ